MPISLPPQAPGGKLSATWPSLVYGIDWDQPVNSTKPGSLGYDPGYTDMSPRVYRGGWTSRRGQQYELGRSESGELSLPLDNTDGALDPDNTGSVFYPDVVPYRSVQIWAFLPANMLAWSTTAMEPNLGGDWTILVNAGSITSYASPNLTGVLGVYVAQVTAPAAGTSSIECAASKRATVTAGTSYTAAANVWPLTASGRQAQVALRWYNSAGTLLSTSSGTVVNLPAASGTIPATQALVTATAPAGAVTAGVQVSYLGGTATNEQYGVDQVTLSAGSAASVVYPVWGGLTERYPQVWEDEQGKVDLTAVGALAGTAKIALSSAIVSQIESNTPAFLYPFDDNAGALSAGGIGTASPPLLTIVNSPNGAGTVTFGNSSTPVGSEDTSLYLNSPASGSSNYTSAGSALTGLPNLTNINAAVTYGVVFKCPSAAPAGATLLYLRDNIGGASSSYLWIYVNGTNGNLIAQTAWGSATITGNHADGNWHVAVFTYNGGSSGQLYSDMLGYGSSVGLSGSGSFSANYHQGYVGAQVPVSGGLGYAWNGNMICLFGAGAAWSSGQISRIQHVALDALAGTGEGDLARSLAVMGGYIRPVTGDSGASPLQGTLSVKGKTLLALWQKLADDTGATLCEYADGTIHLQTRRNRQQTTTSVFTFGENAAGGEIPYEPTIQYDFDPTFVLNTVQVQQHAGVTVIAQDATSVGAYFPAAKTYSDSLLQSAAECVDQANYLVALYKDPHSRLSRLVFKPSNLSATAVPNAWKAALSLEIGSRVTVKRRPLGGGAVKSADFFVEHIEHRVFQTPGEWETELLLSPLVWSNVWVLGDPVASVLGSTTRLAW